MYILMNVSDSMDRFNETTLPNIEKFYSRLQLKHISKYD